MPNIITTSLSAYKSDMDSRGAAFKNAVNGIVALTMAHADKARSSGNFEDSLLAAAGLNKTDFSDVKYNVLNAETNKAIFSYLRDRTNAIDGDIWPDNPEIMREPNFQKGAQRHLENLMAFAVTRVYPTIRSSLDDMIVETKYEARGKEVKFKIPSNQIIQWSDGAPNNDNFGRNQIHSKELTLLPRPVGGSIEWQWDAASVLDLDVGAMTYACVIGYENLESARVAKAMASLITKVTGTNLFKPAPTRKNILSLRQDLKKYNGNMGTPVLVGTEVAVANIDVENNNLWYGVSEQVVKMGMVDKISKTPIITFDDAFVPSTYYDKNPTSLFGNKYLYMFSVGAQKFIKRAIGGQLVSITTSKTEDMTTYFDVQIETATAVVTAAKIGVIDTQPTGG